MFSRLSLSALIEVCRVLRHYLGAGLMLEEVFRQLMTRGPSSVRPVAARIALVLRRGGSLESALEKEQKYFPPIFLAMAKVGERTGMLPEVFNDLEQHFLGQKKLRGRFIGLSAWPLIQFFLAVMVLALLIFAMGMFTGVTDLKGRPYDPLGLGLSGWDGALIFLGVVFGSLIGAWLSLWLLGKVLPATFRDRLLLMVPVLGGCLRDLALTRFCLALRLTTDSGMSIGKAIRLSMEATSNAAFVAASPAAERTVAEGDDLTLALTRTRMMPDDFLRIIQVAEESGTLTEVLKHQGEHYQETAARRMTVVTFLFSVLVWLGVGAFIIYAIFRIFSYYMGLIDDAANFQL
jgi:type IV pilus assembly protein PilC